MAALLGRSDVVHLPHLADAEVRSVVRSLVLRQEITAERATAAVDDLQDVRAARHPAGPFLARAWEFRSSVTTYDALHVALAEALETPLVTFDARLARAPGARCPTVLV